MDGQLGYQCLWKDCNDQFIQHRDFIKHLSNDSHVGQTPFLPKKEKAYSMITEKEFKCSKCPKSFADASNRKVSSWKTKLKFQKHELTHDENRQRFFCDEIGCKKSYSIINDLRQHKKIHRGEFNYKCSHPTCDRAFIRISELYSHEVIFC